MNNTGFISQIIKEIKLKKSHICVGLDSDYEKIPSIVKKHSSITETIFSFNKRIIDSTYDIVPAYKSNIVFYAGYGIDGLKALKMTNNYIRKTHPNIKIIADCKRSEMKRSAEMASKELFDEFGFDAFTATPWFGFDTIEPYQSCKNKAVFVLCHDSNPSAGDIQDVKLSTEEYLYEYVTKLVCQKWNATGNILIEAPLTYPEILNNIKNISGRDQFFLIAGLGSQGGDIKNLSIFNDKNFIVNASRSIIFASDKMDFDLRARDVVLNYNTNIATF